VRSVAACCMVRVHVAYAGRVDCLRCVELLPSQVGLLPRQTPAEGRAANDAGAGGTDQSDLLMLTEATCWRPAFYPVAAGLSAS
jgi:hypothetical protein